MARPRTKVDDETAVVEAYAGGTPIAELARLHRVDRFVIRRIVTERGGDLIAFPNRRGDRIPPGHLTSHQMAERAGITIRQLAHWVAFGLIEPTITTTSLNGSTRLFPPDQIAVTCLMGRLVAAGVGPRAASDLARSLTETGTAELAGIRIDLPEEH